MDIGESHVAAVEPVRQLGVIHTQQVQHRRVQIVDGDRLLLTMLHLLGMDHTSRPALRKLLEDPEPAPRIVAAEALGRFGSETDVPRSLDVLVALADAENNGAYVAMMAMNALDYMDDRARSAKTAISELPDEDRNASRRFSANIARLIDKALADLDVAR